jgi:hypothetical protein
MKGNRSGSDKLVAFIFPACIGFGTGIGALIHNVGLGIASGAVVGTVLSLIGQFLVKANSN